MRTLREVAGFPGYMVGDDGSVWTTKVKGGNDRTPGRRGQPRPLQTQRDQRGYVQVNLDVDGTNHVRAVHRLVLEAFVGPRPPDCEACHYPDHDKTNNRLENLRWDTHATRDPVRKRAANREYMRRVRRCGGGRAA